MVPRRPLPENLAAIQDRLEDEGVEIHEALTDGRLVVRGNVIELIQEPEAIEEHLVFLETLGDDGAAAARNLRSLRPQFLIFARSVLAGRSGCYVIYAGEDCQAYRAFDPRCKDLELEMFRRDSACHRWAP